MCKGYCNSKVVPHMIYDASILCILHNITFFATKVASERDPLPNDDQWVVVNSAFMVDGKEAHLF